MTTVGLLLIGLLALVLGWRGGLFGGWSWSRRARGGGGWAARAGGGVLWSGGGSPSSGFLGRPRRRLGGKSLWDLMDLISKLLIPLVVALATIWFGAKQTHLAAQQHQSDQRLALNQQRAAILQTYIDNMQALLLNHHLTQPEPGDEVATVQTLTTLRRLDADRNTVVVRFLHDARLIGTQHAVLNLSNANLSSDLLSGIDLSDIDLSGDNLTGADLSRSILNGQSTRCQPHQR